MPAAAIHRPGAILPLGPPAKSPPLDGRAAIHDDRQARVGRDAGRIPVHHAKLQPQAARPDRHRLMCMWHAQLGAAEDIDHVERPGRVDGLGQRPERRDPKDRALVGIDWNAVEALVQEVAQYGERRPRGVRRGTNDRDPPRLAQDDLDGRVVEDPDRAATLLEVEEGARSGAVVRRQ